MRYQGATVATVLLPVERARLEAAGQGCFRAMHGDSVEEAARHIRRGAAEAVFLSVHRCGDDDLPRVARLVHEFPHVPAVALISRQEAGAADRVLRLGASGVREIVDVTAPAGWQRLRDLLREPTSPVVASVMAALEPELAHVPPDCRLFFEIVIHRATELVTVGALARALNVVPSSFMSRFARAELPSPKTYLAHARLLHAAYLFKSEGLRIADVAHRLEYSSSQSFGRHVFTLLGLTAGEFRWRLPFEAAVERFRGTLLAPFRDRLITFHPLGTRSATSDRYAA